MILIDGSQGEGGGQILRTSLALSMITRQPFIITGIRAGRQTPGLMRQHLTAVNAAAEVSGAEVTGNAINSQELTFAPGEITPGEYRFAVGTAGSGTLVLQTVLPALLTAREPSHLTLEGGTHNPYAPPFDFLDKAYLPVLNKMGASVTATLERPGFYPTGGGAIEVTIESCEGLVPLDLMERGKIKRRSAWAVVARLPRSIGEREVKAAREVLGWEDRCFSVEEVLDSQGPGNVFFIEIKSRHITEVFTGFGERGVPAETVGSRAASQALEYIDTGAPVGRHLADQLLIPMALAGGGEFLTVPPTRHTRTNIDVMGGFLDLDITCEKIAGKQWKIAIEAR